MACNNWFKCNDDKRRNLGFMQILQLLVTGVGVDDCPAIRVSGDVNAVVTPSTPVQRTLPVATEESGVSGNVAAGAKWVEFITSADFVGTINGANYPAGFGKMYPPLPNGDTYPQINWTKSAGTIRVEYLT